MCSALEPPAAIRGVTQSPLHGVSFAYTFDDPAAPARHHTQYFEMFGHRSIDHDGWRAVVPRGPGPPSPRQASRSAAPITAGTLTGLDAARWELYHVADDPAENHDLAAGHRDKVIEMIARWYVEAGKYNVLPRRRERPGAADYRAPADRGSAGQLHLPARHPDRPGRRRAQDPNRPHAITADVDIPAGGAEGVLLSQGTGVGGWSFYRQGRQAALRPQLRPAGLSTRCRRRTPCHAGILRCASSSSPPGNRTSRKARALRAALSLRRRPPGRAGRVPGHHARRLNPGGLTCGADPGLPVTPDYQSPFGSPASCTPSPSTCQGISSPTPKARCAWRWRGSSGSADANPLRADGPQSRQARSAGPRRGVGRGVRLPPPPKAK